MNKNKFTPTIEEMEERAAEWAATADDFRTNGDSDGDKNMGAIRFAQDKAAQWAAKAQAARQGAK